MDTKELLLQNTICGGKNGNMQQIHINLNLLTSLFRIFFNFLVGRPIGFNDDVLLIVQVTSGPDPYSPLDGSIM